MLKEIIVTDIEEVFERNFVSYVFSEPFLWFSHPVFQKSNGVGQGQSHLQYTTNPPPLTNLRRLFSTGW